NGGTEQDPDLNNYKSYPVPRSSLKRKFTRDLTGQLGWRRVRSIYRTLWRLNELSLATRQYFLRSVGANAVMLLILTLFGAPWLYLMWVAAFMTSHMLVTRIRQIAEHAAVPDAFNLDPRLNTRTLYINPLERFFIAPHQVNFHLEHHMLASVPIYRLETMHKMLLENGFYKDIEFQQGYFNLLRRVTYA
ncbi:MAG: fatty acid desaturase, partial [bacterium]